MFPEASACIQVPPCHLSPLGRRKHLPPAKLYHRPVPLCHHAGTEFSQGTTTSATCRNWPARWDQCCFCLLLREFVLQVSVELHISYIALGHRSQLCKCWYQGFPLADSCQGWEHWWAYPALPCPSGSPSFWDRTLSAPQVSAVLNMSHSPVLGRYPSWSPGRCPMPRLSCSWLRLR